MTNENIVTITSQDLRDLVGARVCNFLADTPYAFIDSWGAGLRKHSLYLHTRLQCSSDHNVVAKDFKSTYDKVRVVFEYPSVPVSIQLSPNDLQQLIKLSRYTATEF